MNTDQQKTGFWINDWWVKPDLLEIRKGNITVRLEPKVMDLLVELASRPGEVFSRQELEETIWRGTVVGYDALSKAITKLRDALKDDKKNPQYIQTLPKKGYRVIATVRFEEPAPSAGLETQHSETVADKTKTTKKVFPNSFVMSIAGTVLLLVIVTVVYIIFYKQSVTNSPPTSVYNQKQTFAGNKPVVVILPFRNISPDEKDGYLANGMTSDLITNLSKLSGLLVTAINTVQTYQNIDVNPETIKQDLNANYVLNGDVSRIEDKIRINVHLTDIEQGNVLWADRYDRQLTDFFAIQDEVTSKIIQSLALTLTKEEKQRIARRYTNNFQAYEFFLKGQYQLIARTQENNYQAQEFYRKAIELDPGFSRAYAGLAMSYAVAYNRGWPSDIEYPMQTILDLSNRAIRIDKDLPESYWVAGYVHANQKKPDKAIEFLMHALSLNPNYADAYAMLAAVHISSGLPEKALDYITRATQLNPNGGHLYLMQFGRAYYYLEDYQQALRYFQQANEGNPNNIDVLLYLIATYVNLNRLDDAHWSYMEARNINSKLDIQAWIERFGIVDNSIRSKLEDDLRTAEKYFSQRPSK